MKKNQVKQLRFALSKKGYDIDAVESYIALEHAKNAETQMEQKERIITLKAQVADLANELASLRGREEQIKNTLVSATEKAERMDAEIKSRYRTELDRLRLFRAKWTKAYEELSERYHFSKDALNMESVAVSTELEIQKFLSQDFGMSKGENKSEMELHFQSEVERLTSGGAKSTQKLNGNLTNSTTENTLKKQDSFVFDNQMPQSAVVELKERIKDASDKKTKQNINKTSLDSVIPPIAAFSIEDALTPKESLAEICHYLGLGQAK